MSEQSVRLALPFLLPAQAQKHVTHNEALERLDLIVQTSVESFEATTPPANPQEGQIWALGNMPDSDWVGQGGKLAAWTRHGWDFITPQPGWTACAGTDLRVFTGDTWVHPDPGELQNLPGLGVNTSFDATSRLAVAAQATLLSHDGAGHQLKINKASAIDTASLLFQTDWGGRAEMGTTGSDDFTLKVSADGGEWHVAAQADGATGQLHLPSGLEVSGPLSLPAGSVDTGMLADGAGCSVIGRSAENTGPMTPIIAGTNHQVLRRAGGGLGFGPLALDQGAAVSGTLPLAHGGTGASTAQGAHANLGLGTAATASITQSVTDSTPGRVTKTGDFGIGGVAAVTADFNDAPSGAFAGTSGSSGQNRPTVSGGGGASAVTWRFNTSFAMQIGGALNPANGLAWRAQVADIWQDWKLVFDRSNILGTVSQSGGVPTGAIIQRGSNANGEFVRFADGTQICTQMIFFEGIAFTIAEGALYRSAINALSWTFPASFVAPRAMVSAIKNSGISSHLSQVAFAGTTTSATTASNFVGYSTSAATMDVRLNFLAIGRWF